MESEEAKYPYVHWDVPCSEVELAGMQLWDLGAQGVEERDQTTIEHGAGADKVTLVASFETVEAAESAILALGDDSSARLVFVEGEEWRHSWKRFFRPKRHGRRFVVTPPWESVEPEADDLVIEIEPGNAFGTGMHETTSLVLAEIEELVRPGQEVLDVGCGSGILSIGAILCGAEKVVAVDIDPDAVVASRENAQRNGVLDRLIVSTDPIEAVPDRYDVILANIQAHILIAMANELIIRLKPGAALVLSGVLKEAADEVIGSFGDLHLQKVESMGDWVAIRLSSEAA